jgi:hypothetical protein
MLNLFKKMNQKFNGFIWTLVSTGILLLILGVLMVWTNFMVKLVMGIITIVIAYVFFYAAIKLYYLRKDIEDHFKF